MPMVSSSEIRATHVRADNCGIKWKTLNPHRNLSAGWQSTFRRFRGRSDAENYHALLGEYFRLLANQVRKSVLWESI